MTCNDMIVGSCVGQVPADQLTVGVMNAVQSLLELAESSVHKGFVMDVYRHLVFNFHIWSHADYNVQSGMLLHIGGRRVGLEF